MHLLVFCSRLAVMPSILVSVLDIYWAVWTPVSSIAAPTAMPTARSTAMPIASSYLDFIFYFIEFSEVGFSCNSIDYGALCHAFPCLDIKM
jgi:hypothetical protein